MYCGGEIYFSCDFDPMSTLQPLELFFLPTSVHMVTNSTKLYKIIKANIRTAAGRSGFHLTSTSRRLFSRSGFSPRRSTYVRLNKFIKNLNKFIQLYTNVLKSRFWGYPPPSRKKFGCNFSLFDQIRPISLTGSRVCHLRQDFQSW